MNIIKRLLRTEFRIAAYPVGGGAPANTYGASRRAMRARAQAMRRDPAILLWTLYKTGPLLMQERKVMEGTGGKACAASNENKQ